MPGARPLRSDSPFHGPTLMQFSFQFPPADDAPAQARAALEVFDQILSAEVLEDLQLVVSELVANSVKFGPKRPITLALTIGLEGVVTGEVIDQGDGERAKVEMSVEPTLAGGWGLHLVDQVARRWGVHEGSTHVWFEIGPKRRRRS
jgi:anti-sigma regulatory factor (Ser/Thr protein kinase)